jgi:hypothetical protein
MHGAFSSRGRGQESQDVYLRIADSSGHACQCSRAVFNQDRKLLRGWHAYTLGGNLAGMLPKAACASNRRPVVAVVGALPAIPPASAWKYCLGVFTPVLAKHTKHLSLVDVLSEIDRIQRNFEPMKKQVEA